MQNTFQKAVAIPILTKWKKIEHCTVYNISGLTHFTDIWLTQGFPIHLLKPSTNLLCLPTSGKKVLTLHVSTLTSAEGLQVK